MRLVLREQTHIVTITESFSKIHSLALAQEIHERTDGSEGNKKGGYGHSWAKEDVEKGRRRCAIV